MRLRAREWLPLAMLAVVASGLWAFVEIADEVRERDTESVDRRVLVAMRASGDLDDPVGPIWVEEMARDITALGGLAVLALVTIATCLYLALYGRKRALVLVVVTVLGGWAASAALKLGFGRPRPDLVPHEAVVYSASFPSGHAMLSAATYLTLAGLLARIHPQARAKVFFLAFAVLLTLLVGVSRVYLGVHWPTDVLAGWAAGASWALLCWAVALWLDRGGKLEEPAV